MTKIKTILIVATIVVLSLLVAYMFTKPKEEQELPYPVKVGKTIVTDEDYNRLLNAELKNIIQTTYIKNGVTLKFDKPEFIECSNLIREIDSKTSVAEAKSQCKNIYQSAEVSTLNFRIVNLWFDYEADRLNMNVSEQELSDTVTEEAEDYKKAFEREKKLFKKEIKDKKKLTAALERLEEAQAKYPKITDYQKYLGFTQADIIFNAKTRHISNVLFEKADFDRKVTDKEAKEYFEKHKETFRSEYKYSFQAISAESLDKAKEALEEIVEDKKEFLKVLEKYNNDPNLAKVKGKIVGMTTSQLSSEPELSKAIVKSKVGKWSGPTTLSTGFLIYKPYKIEGGKVLSYDKKLKEAIKEEIKQTRKDAFWGELTERWRPKTTCRTTMTIPNCNNYEEPKDLISEKVN